MLRFEEGEAGQRLKRIKEDGEKAFQDLTGNEVMARGVPGSLSWMAALHEACMWSGVTPQQNAP